MYLDHTFGLRLSLSELAQQKFSQKVKSPIVLTCAIVVQFTFCLLLSIIVSFICLSYFYLSVFLQSYVRAAFDANNVT